MAFRMITNMPLVIVATVGALIMSTTGQYLEKEQMPPWGTITNEREPTCAELKTMWRHTRRIIRHAAENSNLNSLPSFVNSVEYAFAPKFLQFWSAKPKTKSQIPYGRVLTKTKTKRPPPTPLGNTKYQLVPRMDKVARTPGIGMGYFHEDDEGGELIFQDSNGSGGDVAMPKEDDFALYGTIVRTPDEKYKLRREFLLSRASNRANPYEVLKQKSKFADCVGTYGEEKTIGTLLPPQKAIYGYRTSLGDLQRKVENLPCRNDMDCFCSKSIHPYTCHETLQLCSRKGGMSILRDTYGRWFSRPFEPRELGRSEITKEMNANNVA